MKKYQVMKIGGAVLNKPENFKCLINIIDKYCALPTIFVFSAFSKLSRKLRELAKIAKNNGLDSAKQNFAEIRKEIDLFVQVLLPENHFFDKAQNRLSRLYEEIEKILFGISVTKELTSRTLDRVLSFGEYISSIILQEYLKFEQIEAIFIDSAEIIITDTTYGSAKPVVAKTAELVQKLLIPKFNESNIIFLPGFIGSSENKTITTMGFESSNLTALLLASIIQAEAVVFWTDVKGIRTSDPKIVEGTQLIPSISFDDSYIASLNGLKLIHPSMYEYFRQNPHIQYIYKSAFEPDDEETIVAPNTKQRANILLISEPYSFNQLSKENNEFIKDAHFCLYSKDFSFLLREDTANHHQTEDVISIISILNIPGEKIVPLLDKIYDKIRFFYVYPEKTISKLFVGAKDVGEVANYLHSFLFLKK